MLLNVLVLLILMVACGAWRGALVTNGVNMALSRTVRGRNSVRLFAGKEAAPEAPADDPYLVHYCISCEYEYDEAKGFKKRMPPGTRFRDVETFNCPVCGASINQFKVKEE